MEANWDISKSPFYGCPEKFLKVGQRVRAKVRVYDLPGASNPGIIHAEPGDLGSVVCVDKGLWPTVTFDKTGTSSCVTDFEVEPVGD